MALKVCRWCKRELYLCDLTDMKNCAFGHSKHNSTGHENKCKQCRNSRQRMRQRKINGDPLIAYHLQNWRRAT